MKKLMFGAAVAAMGLTTFGANPATQVYDVQLSIKSTAAASAKNVTNKTNPLAVKDDQKWDILYRKQASYTWKGLIWGCDCESIDGVWEKVVTCGEEWDTVKGCILWDSKTGAVTYIGYDSDLTDANSVPGTGFGWKLLQCINKDGKQVEGVWEMRQYGNPCAEYGEYDEELFWFVGAGFGSNVLVTYKDATDGLLYVECESRIAKMNGNFAGYMWAPDFSTKSVEWGCTFCGGGTITGECVFAYPWAWCEDFNDVCDCNVYLFDEDHTAAYGTWTLKYNDSISKKLQKATTILDAYNFKKLPLVAKAILTVEDIILNRGPVPPPDPCPDLKKAVEDAKAAYDASTVAVANLDDAILAQKWADANGNLYDATTNAAAAAVKTNDAQNAWIDATNAVAATGTFYYVNGSAAEVRVDSNGAQEMLDNLNYYSERYTIVIRDGRKISFNSTVYDSVAAAKTGVQAVIDDVPTKENALIEAQREKQVADQGLVFAEQEVKDLEWTQDPAQVALKRAQAQADQAAKLVDLKAAEAAYAAAECK